MADNYPYTDELTLEHVVVYSKSRQNVPEVEYNIYYGINNRIYGLDLKNLKILRRLIDNVIEDSEKTEKSWQKR